MKILVKKFQEGGNVAPAVAPAQGGVEEQLAQFAQQLVEMLMQNLGDPQAVTAVLQMALDIVQGAGQEPAQPVFKKGGKLVKKNTKKACGGLKIR